MTAYRIRIGALTLACLLALHAAHGAPPRGETHGWALVVGIDRYESSDLSPLKCPRNDARAVAQALIDSCGYRPDHVILITSDAAEAREKPTSSNILRWLYGLRKAIKPDDTFIFYFSGHGMVSQGESFLLTSESTLGGLALLRKSSLSVKDVQDALKEIHARRILQLIDACRNDPQRARGVGDSRMTTGFSRDLVLKAKDLPGAEIVATVFACRAGQRSFENCEGHGYFTYFLLQGLYGAAADASGVLTLSSLVSYLEQKVPEAVALREQGQRQEPWADISGNGALQWVLGGTPSPPATASASVVLRVASGVKTPASTFIVPLVIGGGRPQQITLSVNGQPLTLSPSDVTYTSGGATANVKVPLEIGDNTVVAMAVGATGVPVQSSVVVVRDPSAVAPVASAALPSVPSSGRVTAQAAATYYTGALRRELSEYDKDRAKWGRDAADMMRPTTTLDRDK